MLCHYAAAVFPQDPYWNLQARRGYAWDVWVVLTECNRLTI